MSAAIVVIAKSLVFLALHLSHRLNLGLGHAVPVADAFDAVSVQVAKRLWTNSGLMVNSYVLVFVAAVSQMAFTNRAFGSTSNYLLVAYNYCELASQVRGSHAAFWLSDST